MIPIPIPIYIPEDVGEITLSPIPSFILIIFLSLIGTVAILLGISMITDDDRFADIGFKIMGIVALLLPLVIIIILLGL